MNRKLYIPVFIFFGFMKNFAALLNPLSLDSLRLMIAKNLSLWVFISTDGSCAHLFFLYRIFKRTIDLSQVSAESVLEWLEWNRYEFYEELRQGSGRDWLDRQAAEILRELKKL